MKAISSIFVLLLLAYCDVVWSQRRCGIDELKATLMAKDSGFATRFDAERRQMEDLALFAVAKPTHAAVAEISIPVVFHIVVNQAQFIEMGGNYGIIRRCDSQIAVLNRDFNGANPDTALIPSLWKPLFANVGIHFALAHNNPIGRPTPGYDIRIVPNEGFFEGDSSFHVAKSTELGGLDGWDATKYCNVWCINMYSNGGNSLLGITVPRSFAYSSGPLGNSDVGICILYDLLGTRSSPADSFPHNVHTRNYFDLGRTLTHEMGHFFEIWHVWGDDGTACPWSGGNSVLPDLPPQGGSTEGNPDYSIPGGTIHDNCADSFGTAVQPIGTACLDYLDYTDDQGMHMFTKDQAAIMIAQVSSPSGESYSLTQHPDVLQWPSGAPEPVLLFPNPTTGIVGVSYAADLTGLNEITVTDLFGRIVKTFTPQVQSGYCTVDLRPLPNGIYLFKVVFNGQSMVQQVALY